MNMKDAEAYALDYKVRAQVKICISHAQYAGRFTNAMIIQQGSCFLTYYCPR